MDWVTTIRTDETAQTYDGLILEAGRGQYLVQTTDGAKVRCKLRGNLKKRLTFTETANHSRRVEKVKKLQETDPCAVGDRVAIAIDFTSSEGVIEHVYERRGILARQSGNERERQTLVANLELAVIVFAVAEPRLDPYKLDRFLVLAEDNDLECVIVINKCDLPPDSDIDAYCKLYEDIGYQVIRTSKATGDGIEELRDALSGRISALCGPSGVGKSSLLNCLQPGLALKIGITGDVTHAGRHTTVRASLLPLECGGWVADTPGLRQVEFWDLPPDDIAWCFPEMSSVVNDCRFANCRHDSEPGCAVKAQLAKGKLSEHRYTSYLSMIAPKALS